MPQIHWSAPSLTVASLIVGFLFALGHHLFYASLDRQRAATTLEGYGILGMHVSIQQINTAVGTAFAFLVRACLMLSISIAYFQIFMWSVGSHEKKGTQLVHLDVMTSALHDLVSLANFRTWRRRPWLWLLAVVAWYGFSAKTNISVSITNILSRLMPIASIVTPATLSVSIDFPPPTYMNVPNVEFSSLNLVAPLASYGTTGSGDAKETPFAYMYAGPSLTVQRIANAVAAQGSILPVTAPSVNSTWDLAFDGPSLHCHPVSLNFRQAALDNILNYTFAPGEGESLSSTCAIGPGYMAWHPKWMTPNDSMEDRLPFNINDLNSSSGSVDIDKNDALNHDNSHGYPYSDMASIFLAITPTLFPATSGENSDSYNICHGEPSYQANLAHYNETSTVLRCNAHRSTYHTTFSFVDGVQNVHIRNVTDITDTPMITIGSVLTYFNSSDLDDTSLQAQACPPSKMNPDLDNSDGQMQPCLLDPLVLSTLSYQAVMHAFINLVAGMISLGNRQDLKTLIDSTTQVESTVLALAPELAFLQAKSQNTRQSAQQRAVTWNQQPFTGLVNAAAAADSTLPFQQALEQLFQNITISLMSAPDLQYVHHLPLLNGAVSLS